MYDVITMEQEDALDQFVAEWRRELGTSGSRGRLLGKRGVKKEEERVDEVWGSGKRVVYREPSPLLVLPAGRGDQRESVPTRREDGSRVESRSPCLLDRLLADLVRWQWGHGAWHSLAHIPLSLRMTSTLSLSLR